MFVSTSGKNYIRASLLGKGAYGSVYQCFDDKGNEYAYKNFIHNEDSNGLELGGIREISILKKLEHPNIVSVVDTVLDIGEMGMILPKALCTLDIAIKGGFFKKNVKNRLAYQIIDAMTYMHSYRYIHRDIKPDNVLVFKENGDWNIKIADLSLATCGDESFGDTHTTSAGTSCYKAPEVGENSDNEKSNYTMIVDEWSLGVVLLELYLGKIDRKTLKKIDKIKNSLDESDKINVVIKGFLEVDPAKRLSCQKALKMLGKETEYEKSNQFGIKPIKSVKIAAKPYKIKNELTMRMASYYVKAVGCEAIWGLKLASKLYELQEIILDVEYKEEYEEAEVCIIKDLEWNIM